MTSTIPSNKLSPCFKIDDILLNHRNIGRGVLKSKHFNSIEIERTHMSADNLNAIWGGTFVPQSTKRYKVDEVFFQDYSRNTLLRSNKKSHLRKDGRLRVQASGICLNEDISGRRELERADHNKMQIFQSRCLSSENEPGLLLADTIHRSGGNSEMDIRDCEIDWKSLTICEKIGEGMQ
jgi:hypothetical protein